MIDTFLLWTIVISSLISWLAARYLLRKTWKSRATRVLAAGFLPIMLATGTLIFGYIIWLLQADSPQRSAYSPLVFFVFGFWMVPIIVSVNLLAAFFAGLRK